MSIGRVEHNIASVLEVAIGVEDTLSLLYSRLRLLCRDPDVRLLLVYLSEECLSHRKFLEELLSHNLEKYRVSPNELREVAHHIVSSFREVRELYERAWRVFEWSEIVDVLGELEKVSRTLVDVYTSLREFHEREERLGAVLDLLIEDSRRHSEILELLRKTTCTS